VIFAKHVGANYVILQWSVAKWWCIKRFAISGPLCTICAYYTWWKITVSIIIKCFC